MDNKRKKRLSIYYVVIIIFCLLLGLFIWFSFRAILSDLDKKKEDAYKKKTTSSLQQALRFINNSSIKTNFYEKNFFIPSND